MCMYEFEKGKNWKILSAKKWVKVVYIGLGYREKIQATLRNKQAIGNIVMNEWMNESIE